MQTNLPNFALYVTMFPQLIAGPIVQYADVDEQLASRESLKDKIRRRKHVFYPGTYEESITGEYLRDDFYRVKRTCER